MIPYLPEIYEDELFYSYLARINVHIGFTSIGKAKDCFYKARKYNIDTAYLGYLSDSFMEQLFQRYERKKILLEHTLFPFMSMFKTGKRELMSDVYNGKPILLLPAEEMMYVRYCPICAKDDYEKYNESYFHTSHQVQTFCVKHYCKLLNTDIPLFRRYADTKFIALEEIREQHNLKKEHPNVHQSRYEQFIQKAFKRSFDIDENIKNHPFEIYKQRYDQSELLEDMTRYYSKNGIMNHIDSTSVLSYVIRGKITDTQKILQLAYFLNLDVNSFF